jgi:hypothetical protein
MTAALAQAEHNSKFARQQQITVEQKLQDTPSRLVTPPDTSKDAIGWNGLSRMRSKDIIQLVLFGGLTMLSFYICYSNVLTNLLATGEPVFLDSPVKAMMIALLAPAVAATIKILPGLFEREAHQSLCRRSIYGITAISALMWIALFSHEYNGLSGGMPELSDFSLDGSNLGSWLTFSQLFTEIMVGASLFIRFTSILDIYEPERSLPNPNYNALLVDLEQVRLQAQVAQREYEAASNALQQLRARRDILLQDALGKLAGERARFNDLYQS